MKSEDFLHRMSLLDDDLIREAKEKPDGFEDGTEFLEQMSLLDDDLILEASGTQKPGARIKRRADIVSISSKFMKAAAVALLIGAASVTAVSVDTDSPSNFDTDSSSGSSGYSGISDLPDSSASDIVQPKTDGTDEPGNLSGTDGEDPALPEPEQEDGSALTPGGNSPSAASGEDKIQNDTGAGGTATRQSGGSRSTSGRRSASSRSQGTANTPDSAASSDSGQQNSGSGNNSSGSTPSQLPDSTEHTDSRGGTESQNQSVPDEPDETDDETGLVRASYNGNSYVSNRTETQSWQVAGYLGTVEVTDEKNGVSVAASAYSIDGTGEDRAIAVRIGDSDKLITCVSEAGAAASQSEEDTETPEPESDAESEEISSADSEEISSAESVLSEAESDEEQKN